MEKINDNYLFRAWNLTNSKELDNVKKQQLYFNPCSNYSSDGELEFTGSISESGISEGLQNGLNEMRQYDYCSFLNIGVKLSAICGVNHLVGDEDFIEQVSNSFARLFNKRINDAFSNETSNRMRESLLNNIGMVCFSQSYPNMKLLEAKGGLNGYAVCGVYDLSKIIDCAQKISNAKFK